MKIEYGKRVRVKVKLSVVDGDVIEQSAVEYFQGSGTMLPGLEQRLEGLEAGAKQAGVLKASEAFGAKKANRKIPRSEFPADAKLDVGMRFEAKAEGGAGNVVLEVVEATKETVEVRLCHPLADKDISFEFEVLKVSDPVPPPLPPGAG